MEAYQDFAYVYDKFMDETPYEEWAERLHKLIEKYGLSRPERDAKDVLESEKNLVVDLGCGTGTLTELLYQKGYDMIGVDNSESMLGIAMNKKAESGSEILYLLQDMRELELYSTVGTVVSVCDSVNYKYREIIGETTIAENREDCSFIWENYYDEEECINQYDLTIFVQEKNELFRRFSETHFQRGYTAAQIEELLQQAGLGLVKMLDADTEEDVTPQSERILVIATEQGKSKA